jgi:hypothetical protein
VQTVQTTARVHSPIGSLTAAESRRIEAKAEAEARARLSGELADAITFQPTLEVWTPGWCSKMTAAHEVLHEALGSHTKALAQLLRDAVNGKDVKLQAELLLSLACGEHAANHCDEATQ